MQKQPRKVVEKPAYLLESVDNALKLIQVLRDVGALRVSDAAEQLGIAPSTAHRLFAMLVYRGFAVQDEKRLYHPGPAMGAGPAQRGWTRELTDLCRPHMEALAVRCGETVNLAIRVGTQVRFLATVESTAILRVGDRQGQVLPAELTASGRILLAELTDELLERLYLLPAEELPKDRASTDPRLTAEEFAELRHQLLLARDVGFALNVAKAEEGVAAFGVALHNRSGLAVAAITVTVPATRFRRHAEGSLPAYVKQAVRDMEVDIAAITP